MGDEIRAGVSTDLTLAADREAPRRLVAMQVGAATVYVEPVGPPATAEADDRIHPVAPPAPQEAFAQASEALRECVRVVGERVEALAERMPQEVTVEFTLSFAAKGQTALIPLFVTAETSAQAGLKVTAKWRRADAPGG